MPFEPLEDKILVKEIKSKELEKTDGGIIISDVVKKETYKAEVLAVGAGIYARETGVFMQTVLSKGDIVEIPSGQGMPISVDGEDCKVIREGDVLGKIGRVELS